ncbi:MAG: hypothetical protein V1907_03915 [Candidatus Kerfeldbacteria bacterium]
MPKALIFFANPQVSGLWKVLLQYAPGVMGWNPFIATSMSHALESLKGHEEETAVAVIECSEAGFRLGEKIRMTTASQHIGVVYVGTVEDDEYHARALSIGSGNAYFADEPDRVTNDPLAAISRVAFLREPAPRGA